MFFIRRIREFITHKKLEAGYRAMAADKEHEAEALEWIESNIDDGLDSVEWEP